MNQILEVIKGRIKNREEHLRELKRLYRNPDCQPPRLSTNIELRFQKNEATLDYAITAASRGKVHRHSDDFDSQLKFIKSCIEGNVKGEIRVIALRDALDYGAYVYQARKEKEKPVSWSCWEELGYCHGSPATVEVAEVK